MRPGGGRDQTSGSAVDINGGAECWTGPSTSTSHYGGERSGVDAGLGCRLGVAEEASLTAPQTAADAAWRGPGG